MQFVKSYLVASLILLILSCQRNEGSNSCFEKPGEAKYLIFIGEKIKVEELPPDTPRYSLELRYAKFKATYKIMEKICGDYDKETIDFIVYDHYGRPPFEKLKNVLLYVYNKNDTFYHRLYTYDNVYKTKDGDWAGPFPHDGFRIPDSLRNLIKAHKIDFADTFSFDAKGLSRRALEEYYPKAYYKIENKRAFPVNGYFVDELVELKKRTVLRSSFDSSYDDLLIEDVELQKITEPKEIKLNKDEKSKFINFAYTFFNYLKGNDSLNIRRVAHSNVYCAVCEEPPRLDYENNLETLDSFLISSKKFLPNSPLMKEIKNKKFNISVLEFTDSKPKNFKLGNKDRYIVFTISFQSNIIINNEKLTETDEFKFIKSGSQFKFIGMESSTNSWD